MKRIRVIPVLLLSNGGIVKTIQFKNAHYIGDPINIVRIFNDKEVDELMILDIDCSKKNIRPNFEFIEKLAGECFMPLSYGGGIRTLDDAKKIIRSGVEKIVLNTSAYQNPNLIKEISDVLGSQSIIISIDYKKNFFGNPIIYTHCGQKKENKNFWEYIQQIENLVAGECLLTCIDNEGKRKGYDISILKKVTHQLKIPVIANGGANSILDFVNAVNIGGASAVAAGSMFVYINSRDSILINYPPQEQLKKEFYSKIIK
jgi:cyclase